MKCVSGHALGKADMPVIADPGWNFRVVIARDGVREHDKRDQAPLMCVGYPADPFPLSHLIKRERLTMRFVFAAGKGRGFGANRSLHRLGWPRRAVLTGIILGGYRPRCLAESGTIVALAQVN